MTAQGSDLPPAAVRALGDFRALRSSERKAHAYAEELRRELGAAVPAALVAGVPAWALAEELGVSHQRVYQIAKEYRTAA